MPAEQLTSLSDKSVEAFVTEIAKQRSNLAQDRSFSAVRNVARALGLQRVAKQQVVVGGTNGKGTTISYLQQLLSQQGARVGTTTSPHLHSYLERIMLNGASVSAGQCSDAIRTIERATSDLPLTYFDLTTLAALYLFQQWEVDIAVIEVGLGGRLDCANVVENDVAVITNVDLDHTALLGDTIAEISQEKLGIVRSNKPLVFGDRSENLIVDACVKKHTNPFFQFGHEFGLTNEHLVFVTRNDSHLNFTMPTSIDHTVESFSTALQVATLLDRMPSNDALTTMRFTAPLGRLEQEYTRDRCWIFDVAHNPAAIGYLRQSLVRQNITECVVVMACFSDKDISGMIDKLLDPVDGEAAQVVAIVMTDSHGVRAMSASTALDKLKHHRCEVQVESELDDALACAMNLTKNNLPIVVLGSFDIVSRARRTLNMCEMEVSSA